MSNKEMTTEKRLKVRLYLSLLEMCIRDRHQTLDMNS